ncbi:hypothetical protein [Bosea sp. (in: a-proteobacteria)]|jgi:hypothetical protein|uniref:hypothetical protein n=1 Tax=Bosea sp. (in: a-proteobacteria) TaxID=1871050 RepID=UPI003F6EB96B
MPNAAGDGPLDSETERRIMLAAGDLAQPVWERVEQAYSRGAMLAEAKQAELEIELTRLAAQAEGAVLDRLVQLVMQTPHSGLRPQARQKHRKTVLTRLIAPYREAGKAGPGDLALWLYHRFGIVPGPLRAFWRERGEKLDRVR